MIGAIFLTTPADHPLFIQEAIVHETAHTILWTLMTLVPLIDETHPSATAMHEMPWSGNRRPFVTLLHGAYVYLMLGHYLLALRATTGLWPLLEARLRAVVSGLPEALDLLRRHPTYTLAGRRFLASLERDAQTMLGHAGLSADTRGYRLPLSRFYGT
jgi:HEXXH motif-containing protein